MSNIPCVKEVTRTRARLYSAMALAVLATTASMGAIYLFEPVWGVRFYHLLFIPPVLVVARWGGL